MKFIETVFEWATFVQNSGLTPGLLALAGFLFFLSLVFSFREIWSWYTKSNQILKELQVLNERVRVLESKMVANLSDAHRVGLVSQPLPTDSPKWAAQDKQRSFPLKTGQFQH